MANKNVSLCLCVLCACGEEEGEGGEEEEEEINDGIRILGRLLSIQRSVFRMSLF